MTIYDLSGQNENFLQKHKNLVMWRIISQQIKCLWQFHRFCPKILSLTTPSGEYRIFSNFFKNFTNDVIMTGSDQTLPIHVWTLSVVDYLVVWTKNKIVRVSLKWIRLFKSLMNHFITHFHDLTEIWICFGLKQRYD